jgi:hypothetical protein
MPNLTLRFLLEAFGVAACPVYNVPTIFVAKAALVERRQHKRNEPARTEGRGTTGMQIMEVSQSHGVEYGGSIQLDDTRG